MTNEKDDGGPAFPHERNWTLGETQRGLGQLGNLLDKPGMSLRQYASIHLRVPESGLAWLDEMILRAKRDDVATAAVAAVLTVPPTVIIGGKKSESVDHNIVSTLAYMVADSMLKERAK